MSSGYLAYIQLFACSAAAIYSVCFILRPLFGHHILAELDCLAVCNTLKAAASLRSFVLLEIKELIRNYFQILWGYC